MTAPMQEAAFSAVRANRRTRHPAVAAALAGVAVAAFASLASAHGAGYGPGMMGGYGGYGMGPGMMGGYGGWGMGPGMMGGYGGYGAGPGVMGGYGGYGAGPGVMRGYGSGDDTRLNLTDEQRDKIAGIQQGLRSRQWDLMGKIQDEYSRRADADDEAAAAKADDEITSLRQQMLANANAERKQIDAVLTKEQREQMRRDGW